jgi:maltose O-acetyltransferase
MKKLLRTLYYRVFPPQSALDVAQKWRERGVKIGEGTAVYPNVTFGRGGRDPITVGENCVLTGCTILGHDASTNRQLGYSFGEGSVVQPVIIEDDCFIGIGAIVLMGVTIGKGSIVGAGAVVTKDVPPGVVVAGNPAQVIGSVDELVQRRRQLYHQHPEYFPRRPVGID